MGFKKRVSRQPKVQRVYARKAWKPDWKFAPDRILGKPPKIRKDVGPQPYTSSK